MLNLVSITLTLIQGHSRLAKTKIQCGIMSTTKQAPSIKHATRVGHFLRYLDCKSVYGLTIYFCLGLVFFLSACLFVCCCIVVVVFFGGGILFRVGGLVVGFFLGGGAMNVILLSICSSC